MERQTQNKAHNSVAVKFMYSIPLLLGSCFYFPSIFITLRIANDVQYNIAKRSSDDRQNYVIAIHTGMYRYDVTTEEPNYDFFGPSSFFPISAPRSLTPRILSNLPRT